MAMLRRSPLNGRSRNKQKNNRLLNVAQGGLHVCLSSVGQSDLSNIVAAISGTGCPVERGGHGGRRGGRNGCRRSSNPRALIQARPRKRGKRSRSSRCHA